MNDGVSRRALTGRRSVPATVDRALDEFQADYARMGLDLQRAESERNDEAGDIAIRMSARCARMLDEWGPRMTPADVEFLRAELVALCCMATMYRSMQMLSVGDWGMSMDSARRLENDVRVARERLTDLERRRENAGTSGDGDSSDGLPKNPLDGGPLYDYVPLETLSTDARRDGYAGYRVEYDAMLNAYLVAKLASSEGAGGVNLLLHGPPGTGKTESAHRFARDIGANLVIAHQDRVSSPYRAETERNLRVLYDRARAVVAVGRRPVVLLLDEIDGIVRNRSSGECSAAAMSSADYSLLARFLTILDPRDGAKDSGVVSVFSTNEIGNIDDAFRRRCTAVFFGYVEQPSAAMALMNMYLRPLTIESTIDPERWSSLAASETMRPWVPGDYARFVREVGTPARVNAYVRASDVDRATLLASTADASKPPNLPRLPLEMLLPRIENFAPITPLVKYDRYKLA